MEKNTELLTAARKAVDAWNGTDTYHQAATIITILVDELEKVYKEIECTSFSNSPLLKGDDIWYVDVDGFLLRNAMKFLIVLRKSKKSILWYLILVLNSGSQLIYFYET